MISAVLLTLGLAASHASMLAPGDYTRELRIGDELRSYSLHIPASYQSEKPTPVVLVFHAAMMNDAIMARHCGLSEKADQSGFVVAYGNGTGTTSALRYWDAGGVRGKVSDDVGYTARLLDDLATVVNVDPKRVFAAGMSNGAMMCYRLAAELSDRIAAIATIAGTMAIEECQPKQSVSVIHFHGSLDGLVHYNGPDDRTPKNLKFLSVDQTMRAWVKANECPETPVIERLDALADNGTTVRRESYRAGKEGAEVVLYVIEGGGHTWPGRDPLLWFLGKSSRTVSANDLMWDFFQKHPKN